MSKSKLALYCVAAVVVLVGLSVVGYACSWVNRTGEIVSVENYETQFDQLHEDWESMRKAEADYCAAQTALYAAVEREASESVISQRETQVLAYGQTYRRIQATYDARMENYFETLDGFVAPEELPDRAPELDAGNC